MLTTRFLWSWWSVLANLHPPRAARSSIRAGRATEAVLEEDAVARRQNTRRLVRADRDACEPTGRRIVELGSEFAQPDLVVDVESLLEAAGPGALDQRDTLRGVARLHAGFAIMTVVEDGNRQVRRALHADCRERAEPHQHPAIPGDDENAAVGLRNGQPQADHRRRAHCAPEIEIAIVVGDRRGIPGLRAEAGDEQQIAAIVEQDADRRAAVETLIKSGLVRDHFIHRFAPISRCDSSTARARSPLKAMSSAAATVSAASSGRSTQCTKTSHSSRAAWVRDPIGTCHGLNSAHSPRIVTSIVSGKRQVFVIDSILMQLPTPLDCINRAPR